MDNSRLLLVAALSLGVLLLAVPVPAAGAASGPPSPAPSRWRPRRRLRRRLPGHLAARHPRRGSLRAARRPSRIGAASEQRVVVEAETCGRNGPTMARSSSRSSSRSTKSTTVPQGLELVRPAGRSLPFRAGRANGSPLALNERSSPSRRARRPARVAFRYAGPAEAEKRFRFLPDGTFEVEVKVSGEPGWALCSGRVARPRPRGLRVASSSGPPSTSSATKSGSSPRSEEEPLELAGGGLRWVGLEDTYFVTVLVPRKQAPPPAASLGREAGAAAGGGFPPLPPEAQHQGTGQRAARGSCSSSTRASASPPPYFGPKQYPRLAALRWGLERRCAGAPSASSPALLVALRWIHDTRGRELRLGDRPAHLAINLPLLPLTHKSYVSMRKMQELNPKMQAIRERWRPKLKDRQGRAQSRGAAQDAGGDERAVQGRGRQSGGRLPADSAPAAGPVGLLQPALDRRRAARRTLDGLDPRPLGGRSLLRPADRHGRHAVSCSSA